MKPPIEKIEIVFQNNGKRKKVLISWLLSQSAQWAYDANPFIVQDSKLSEKIEGVEFGGRPVKPQLIAKYHYLKTVLDEAQEDIHFNHSTEDEAEEHKIEDAETVLEEIMSPGDQLVSDLMDIEQIQECTDIEELKPFLDEKGVKYDKRKKGLEYFQELAIKAI
jgi:hypothetical protein